MLYITIITISFFLFVFYKDFKSGLKVLKSLPKMDKDCLLWKKKWCSIKIFPINSTKPKQTLYGSHISIFKSGIYIGGYVFMLNHLNKEGLVKFIKRENILSFERDNKQFITGNFEGINIHYLDEMTKSNESIFISSSENDVIIKKIIELTSIAPPQQNK
jgi:hypothetical protein